MRDNAEVSICGSLVHLVPYCRKHVDTYHDPYILEMTASEPLTLQEEYDMQASWRDDPKKCTFIVLQKPQPLDDAVRTNEVMIGDVNIFFNDYDDEHRVEIDVMIAEESSRRQGCGREAVQLMMHYAVKSLGVKNFYCKINEQNEASLKLFKKLGYSEVKYVAAFREHELEFVVNDPDSFLRGIDECIPWVEYLSYDNTDTA